MCIEAAMLLSAGFAAGGSVVTLFVTRLFDTRSEKRKERENFFLMVFPKRMELYEEIIKATDFISNPITITDNESTEALLKTVLEKHKVLADLSYRCNIFGSIPATAILGLICKLLGEFEKNIYASDVPGGVKKAYTELVLPEALAFRFKLIEQIRAESGAKLIDKSISEFARKN